MSLNKVIIGVTVLSLLVSAMLLLERSRFGPEIHFIGDGATYQKAAVHLLHDGMYSADGVTPVSDREPGYSAFIALAYFLASYESALVIFAVQVLLIIAASIMFCRELSNFVPDKEAKLTYIILLLIPAVYHVMFSTVREGFSLALFLIACSAFMIFLRCKTSQKAVISGLLFALLILTYYTFLFLPLVFIFFLKIFDVRWRQIGLFIVTVYACIGLWGVRNFIQFDDFHIIDSRRQHVVWYVRGVQAKELRGFEPIRCLWSEYITRDWTGRLEACSFNGIANTQGRVFTQEDISQSYELLRKYFPFYLWFSLFEIIEMHLPYVNGWGTVYNVLAAIGQTVLLFGCVLALVFFRKDQWRLQLLFFTIMAYQTGIFILTDATPRYLVPVLGLYAFFAARGFFALLGKVRSK